MRRSRSRAELNGGDVHQPLLEQARLDGDVELVPEQFRTVDEDALVRVIAVLQGMFAR